jgi:hypothetical protein
LTDRLVGIILKGTNMRFATLILAISCCASAAPTGIAGKWQLTAKDPDDRTVQAELFLQQDGDRVSGSITGPEGSVPLHILSFKDNVLICTLPYSDTDVTLTMKLDGDTLRGEYEADAGPSGPVEAVRAQTAGKLTGIWKLTTKGPDGDVVALRLDMRQDGTALKGNMTSDSFDVELMLEDVKVDGDALSFKVPTPEGTYSVKATINGSSFDGIATAPDGAANPIRGSR